MNVKPHDEQFKIYFENLFNQECEADTVQDSDELVSTTPMLDDAFILHELETVTQDVTEHFTC